MAKRKSLSVLVDREQLALLCLNVDYLVDRGSPAWEEIETASWELGKKHGIDTHKFRMKRGMPKFTDNPQLTKAKNGECPFCGESGADYGSVTIDCGHATQTGSCLACNKSWEESYRLECVTEIEGDDAEE